MSGGEEGASDEDEGVEADERERERRDDIKSNWKEVKGRARKRQ